VDNINLALVGPFAPIIGALIGALIASLVTYFVVVRRKHLVFWIRNSEDIALPLRRQQGMRDQIFSIHIGNGIFYELNKKFGSGDQQREYFGPKS
jgi:hypothetical protein